ncbi:4925_t:CDS:1, partial [Funneliformis mosseae]
RTHSESPYHNSSQVPSMPRNEDGDTGIWEMLERTLRLHLSNYHLMMSLLAINNHQIVRTM